MTSRRKVSLLGLVIALAAPCALSGQFLAQRPNVARPSSCRPADSAAAMSVAGRFHGILSTGDTTGIQALLAADLKVLEGGGVENRQEYLSHHLSEDIEFAKSVNEKKTSTSYACDGNVAWLVSTSTSMGTFNGRPINSVGAELMILNRTSKGWKIRAIHWSSARRQPR